MELLQLTDCIHHMVIETPDGRSLLRGYCKKCGYEREYAATDPKANGRWEQSWDRADVIQEANLAWWPLQDEPLLWLIEDDDDD